MAKNRGGTLVEWDDDAQDYVEVDDELEDPSDLIDRVMAPYYKQWDKERKEKVDDPANQGGATEVTKEETSQADAGGKEAVAGGEEPS